MGISDVARFNRVSRVTVLVALLLGGRRLRAIGLSRRRLPDVSDFRRIHPPHSD